MNTPGKARQPRERNSILKKYYGLSPAIEERTDPLNIDDPTFDGLKYFAKMVKEQPLSGLIKNDNVLVSEMREIDGDMKTLVYENYSKFISATDTIRKMKSNVESMESEMGRLNENIHGIARQCNNINQALEPNRNKIQQLGNVHNQLQRLQFIFDLPNRLEKCLNSKHYAHAVKYYSRARKLLDHYQHMPAFKGIEKDCCSIMDKVKDELWIGMKQPDAPTSKVNEFAKLLVLLKEDPEVLWNTYISVQLELLSKNQPATGRPDNANDLITQYILPLEDVVDHFRSFFLSSRSKNGDSECDTGSVMNMPSHDQDRAKLDLLRSIQPFTDRIFDMIALLFDIGPSPDVGFATDTQPLQQMQYLTDLQQVISTKTSSLSSVALVGERFSEFVASWHSNVIDTLMKSVPLEIKDRIKAFSEKHLLDQDNTLVVDGNIMRGFLDDITIWFGRHMKKNCFLPLQACFQVATGDQQNVFLSRIQAGLKRMWMSMADELSNIPEISHPSTIRTFMVSRLCYDFADHGIVQTYNDISYLLYSHDNNRQHYQYHASSEKQMDSALVADANFVMERYLKIGQQLLNDKMMQDGYQLSNDVQQCYLDYDRLETSQSPARVSSIWPTMLNRLKSLEHIMQAIFPQTSTDESWQHGDTGPATGDNSDNEYDYRYGSSAGVNGEETYLSHDHSTQSLATTQSSIGGAGMDSTQVVGNNYHGMGRGSGGNSSSTGLGRMTPTTTTKFDGGDSNDMTFNMFSNIDKLFADRVDIYRRVDPSPLGVCGGLVRILIKSFHETTRLLQAMDEHMYQQLQLDIEYIQRTLWSYTTDEKWLSTILQDVITGAYLRCRSPESLPMETMEQMIIKALEYADRSP